MTINTITRNNKEVHQVINNKGIITAYIQHDIVAGGFILKPEFEKTFTQSDIETILNKLNQLNTK